MVTLGAGDVLCFALLALRCDGPHGNAPQRPQQCVHTRGAAQATSLPRERVKDFQNEAQRYMGGPPPQVWDRSGARAAVEGIGSGVSKMSVAEQQANGGYAAPRPPITAAEMQRQQQNLLRSNSFQ